MIAAARTLLLLRHAKSDWDGDLDDHERPLSGRGRRDAVAVGESLATRNIEPELVLCSTAVRTRQTWDEATHGGARAREVRHLPAIYGARVSELTALIRATPESVHTMLVLGHAPGIPDLVDYLARRDPDSDDWARMESKFPTSGLASLSFVGTWAEVGPASTELESFEVPRG